MPKNDNDFQWYPCFNGLPSESLDHYSFEVEALVARSKDDERKLIGPRLVPARWSSWRVGPHEYNDWDDSSSTWEQYSAEELDDWEEEVALETYLAGESDWIHEDAQFRHSAVGKNLKTGSSSGPVNKLRTHVSSHP